MLGQQASRYLLKALALAQGGDMSMLTGDCEYLRGIISEGEGKGGLLKAVSRDFAEGEVSSWPDACANQSENA